MTTVQHGLRRKPDLESVYSINADGSHNVLQPADVRGRWHTRRNVVFVLLVAFYLAMPWIHVDGRHAIHFDVPNRTAFLFGRTYTREDFHLVFFLVTGFGFTLFALTSLFGRVWCGYACPQTVFLEGVFRRIERWIEGGRNERLRRNKGPWTFDKLWRKVVKQIAFAAVVLVLTHTLLAYFLPVEELLPAIVAGPSQHWVAFGWTIGLSLVLYFDFAWFREQFCIVLCPYGRLQSALVDEDTVGVGYDRRRGEPRGAKGKAEGDCIDCGSCVNVCPTGIDIRNGLQMECIGCTNCIDACDSIMRQVGRPEGLVRYDSLRGLSGEGRRRLLRPRLVLYALLSLAGAGVFAFAASGRTSFEATALRARGLPYALEGERIRNLYTIHVQNKSSAPARYRLEPASAPEAPPVEWKVASDAIDVGALGEAKVPVFAFVARADYRRRFPVSVRVTDAATGDVQVVELGFQGP